MKESFEEKINVTKEMLNALPKNNKKNINQYINVLLEKKDEYEKYLNTVFTEILRRKNAILDIKVDDNDKIEKDMSKITSNVYLLSKYNSSFEKTQLDKVLYNISKYYKINLEEVNKNIALAINIFKNVGINLTSDDFCYSYYANKYMNVILSKKNDEVIKSTFEELYWKCSDVLVHIELNFKYLYYKYKKLFDSYELKQRSVFLGQKKEEDIINDYHNLKTLYDKKCDSNILTIINKFKEKELIINDYDPVKVEGYVKELIGEVPMDDVVIENMKKFKYSILEYNNYMSVKYIIDAIMTLYKDKAGYVSSVKKELAEIQKKEKALFGINKKISKLDKKCFISFKKENPEKKQKTYDKLSIEMNYQIKELKTLYDNYSMSIFKERLFTSINDNSSYYDVLNLVYSNYVYFVKCIKDSFEEIATEEIEQKINFVGELLLSPYNTMINNINIINEKDIKMIISDCYKLSNFNVNIETFDDEGSLSRFIELINKILVFNYINKSTVKVDDIKFLCSIWEKKIFD